MLKALMVLILMGPTVALAAQQDEFLSQKEPWTNAQEDSFTRFEREREKLRLLNNRSMLTIVQLLVDDELKKSDFIDSLSLTNLQMKEIKRLYADYQQAIKSTDSVNPNSIDIDDHSQVIKEKNELTLNLMRDVSSILLQHQLEHMANMDLIQKDHHEFL